LDHRDTAVLKVWPTAIVLHNFFHFVSPARQNEFVFHPGSFQIFLHEAGQPSHTVQAFFSFFGHFGVQIFVFLSAYGLAKSHWYDDSSWAQFMWGRIKKLYPGFLLIVVPWICAMTMLVGPRRIVTEILPGIIAMLLGVSTLMGFGLPPVGPWWFIPFIVQFYAMWFLLRWIAGRFGWRGLMATTAICILVTSLASPFLARWSINLMMTPIGRMAVICFGIAAARYRIHIPVALAGAGVVALILGSMYSTLFPFTFVGVLLAWLWLYMQTRNVLRRSRLLVRIGECSILIFLLNAIIRNETVGHATTPASQLFWGLLSATLSFAVSYFIAWLLQLQRSPMTLTGDEYSASVNA
jgi:peptidoglycan/LPS O-acetylase OafA/YrhL